jgi:hypothetical protein
MSQPWRGPAHRLNCCGTNACAGLHDQDTRGQHYQHKHMRFAKTPASQNNKSSSFPASIMKAGQQQTAGHSIICLYSTATGTATASLLQALLALPHPPCVSPSASTTSTGSISKGVLQYCENIATTAHARRQTYGRRHRERISSQSIRGRSWWQSPCRYHKPGLKVRC